MKMTYALTTLLCLFSINSFADGLGAPFDFEDTSMLPKGVRTVKLRSFTTAVENKFDANGNSQALGKPFQKNLKMNSLLKNKPANEAELTRGYMEAKGVDPDNDSLGTIDAYAGARVTATVPVFGWGIRDDWSVAIAVPIIYTNTHVDTGFNVSAKAEEFFGKVSGDTNHNGAKFAKSQLDDPVNGQVTAMGYDPLNGEVRTDIGDIRLINKMLLKKADNYAIGIKQSVTVPTGKQASTNKLVAVSTGDNQWDLSASVIGDWYIDGRWTMSGYGGYTVQFSDTTQKRIPISSDSPLGLMDYSTERDLGDIMGAGISAKFKLSEDWLLAAGYDAQLKYSDIYHGTTYSPIQYDWASANTHQQMESAVVGINYSTIPKFRKKEFPVPMDTKVSYSKVLNGKNVPADDILSGELAVYF
jgi:hypothetical protein